MSSVPILRIFVGGEPVAQPRGRTNRFGRPFIPKEHAIHGYKKAVIKAAKIAMTGRKRLEGPLTVGVLFVVGRTKEKSNPKFQNLPIWQPARPDLDNFKKSTWDALKGVVWADDSQVVQDDGMKIMAGSGANLGAYIAIRAAGPAASELMIWKRSWGWPIA